MSLNGKVALVTGGGRGIGRAIALRLARDGADIALVDLTAGGIDAVAAEISALGRASTAITADVSDRVQVFAAVDQAAEALGGLLSDPERLLTLGAEARRTALARFSADTAARETLAAYGAARELRP